MAIISMNHISISYFLYVKKPQLFVIMFFLKLFPDPPSEGCIQV